MKYINVPLDQQIKGLVPGGLAEKDGRLRIGDRLISVNGKHFEGLSKKDAIQLIDKAGDQLFLIVRRYRVAPNPSLAVIHHPDFRGQMAKKLDTNHTDSSSQKSIKLLSTDTPSSRSCSEPTLVPAPSTPPPISTPRPPTGPVLPPEPSTPPPSPPRPSSGTTHQDERSIVPPTASLPSTHQVHPSGPDPTADISTASTNVSQVHKEVSPPSEEEGVITVQVSSHAAIARLFIDWPSNEHHILPAH